MDGSWWQNGEMKLYRCGCLASQKKSKNLLDVNRTRDRLIFVTIYSQSLYQLSYEKLRTWRQFMIYKKCFVVWEVPCCSALLSPRDEPMKEERNPSVCTVPLYKYASDIWATQTSSLIIIILRMLSTNCIVYFYDSSSTLWLSKSSCLLAETNRGPPTRVAVVPIGLGFKASSAVFGKSSHCASWSINASTSVMATMASTIGTALGRTHGSWRPFPRSSTSCPSLVTVRYNTNEFQIYMRVFSQYRCEKTQNSLGFDQWLKLV